ncbi:MAG: hypothetical protein HKN45_10610 [Flavobacteriales bacterium]|nr:hypothetical protein [Flavobacteriales bacterium]
MLIATLALCITSQAQEDELDLLSLLGEEEVTDYTIASFKANRVINLHSLETTARRVLDIKISHRLGTVSGGLDEWFGLDQATIRLGGDYGITDLLMVGIGRSSYEKTYDGYVKFKFLRQSTGKRNMPISALIMSSMAIKTIPFSIPERKNYFSSRLYYAHQIIIGRKFSDAFSMQLSPSLVHRNLVETLTETNDVLALGIAGRIKLTQRLALNAEYIYVAPDQLASQYVNSASIGLDIETGGHVFQLHFTNSTSMNDKGFITETTDEWSAGDIHFGFNISRVFTIKKKNERPSEHD